MTLTQAPSGVRRTSAPRRRSETGSAWASRYAFNSSKVVRKITPAGSLLVATSQKSARTRVQMSAPRMMRIVTSIVSYSEWKDG